MCTRPRGGATLYIEEIDRHCSNIRRQARREQLEEENMEAPPPPPNETPEERLRREAYYAHLVEMARQQERTVVENEQR